ncbi:MAG: hypothetical protein KAH56_05450 [Candidatus Krumholzibacteria bacterium]|nr:hypothetical protein [Candidatus Krumholzibacteria bacterium]
MHDQVWKMRAILFCTALLVISAGSDVVLGAGPIFWDWPADRPFDEMQIEGAAIDIEGNLVGGLAGRTAGPVGPEVFWRILSDGRGGYYTGTGHGGEIHHTTSGDKSRLVTTLEGTEVFSLLRLDGGDLLAGCGPEGQLFRIDDKGQATLLGSVPGGYVWAMATDPGDGAVLLAVGSPAAVFRYDAGSDSLEAVVELPAQNALDLTFDDQGRLLVATQGPGLIYSIDPARPDDLKLLFETAQDEARQFINGPEGDLFVLALNTEGSGLQGGGVSPGMEMPSAAPSLFSLLIEDNGPQIPRAALYRLEQDGIVVPYWAGDVDLMIAAWSSRWGWLGGGPLADDSGRTVLHGLTPPVGSHPVAGWSGGDILDILVIGDSGKDESIIVCQAHPGSVTVLGRSGKEARAAVSPSLDGGLPVRWGRLNWTTSGGAGKVKFTVRGGSRYEPDESWTDWSDSWSDKDRAIPLDPSRFLQWRVEFPATDGEDPIRLTSVSVSAWQDNRAPVIVSFTQEYLKAIHLGMMNNHNDNITQTFRSGLQAEFSQNSTADHLAGPERAVVGRSVRVFTWEGSDPNGDRVIYDLAYRRQGEEAWRDVLVGRAELLGSWDTSEMPDGRYELRLTASDSPDNPGHLAAESSRSLGPILVDNTEPEISGFKLKVLDDGFQVDLTGKDSGGFLAGARLRLPDGTTERLDPVDGICDSPTEKFAAKIVWPRPGGLTGSAPWRVRVEVRDLAGNTTVAEGEVR